MYTKNKLLKNVNPSWLSILDNNELNNIINKLNEFDKKNIFPFEENIFKTFNYFDVNKTKLVLIGQDPYHNIKNKIPQANGLSFSVNNDFPIPPSLKNIFKELKKEYNDFIIPEHGNLIRWVTEENILLLNSSLTVEAHKPASHIKLWQNYTNNIINFISLNVDNVIFLLLGNFAQKKIKFINKERLNNNIITIIKGVHPSPLSANRGFFNSDVFKKCNDFIILQNNLKKLFLLIISKYYLLSDNIIIKIKNYLNYKLINWSINKKN